MENNRENAPVNCTCGSTFEDISICPECGDHRLSFVKRCGVCPPNKCSCTDPDWEGAFRVVAGFRLQERLGQGGQGTVWWALRIGAGYPVEAAVKLYKHMARESAETGPDADPVLRRRTEEVRVLSLCGSSGVPRLLGHGKVSASEYAVLMEYYPYPSLNDFIHELRELPQDTADKMRTRSVCAIVQRTGLALVVPHALKIAHLDLKPHNVLVSNWLTHGLAQQGGRSDYGLVVVDWGAARIYPVKVRSRGAHQDSAWMATPVYCSPEHWKAMRGEIQYAEVASPADVFALGVIWFELLTGELPWQAFDGSTDRTHENLRSWHQFDMLCEYRDAQGRVMLTSDGLALLDRCVLRWADHDTAKKIVNLVHSCLREAPNLRPKAIELVHQLIPIVDISIGL